jgi:high-affinity nickel-transport protein
MIGLLTIVAIGFFLGMRHATDPDHVIAVSTIVAREHNVRRSALVGIAWGIGHTLTILAVGGAIIVFRITLPPRLGLAMELAVGVMLIVLGVKNLKPLLNWSDGASPPDAAEPHYHAHGDYVHAHGHPQVEEHPHRPEQNPVAGIDGVLQKYRSYQLVRPLIIGTVHGLAGSAAIALLVLSTIPSLNWAIAYLLTFGVGTILGMMLITFTLGSTLVLGQRRFVGIARHLTVATGLISVAFGLFIAYDIGIVNGLFTGHPNWTPR